MNETLTITLTRGEHILEHHIDCQLLNSAGDSYMKAALLWEEYMLARRTLEHKERLAATPTPTRHSPYFGP